MKMKKKLIIVALILLSLFMISAVSAATNTTQEDVIKSDATQTEKISHTDDVAEKSTSTHTVNEKKSTSTDKKEENKDDKLSSTPDNNVLRETDDGTFTTLQQKIDDAPNNSIIELNNSYEYNDGFNTYGINISGKTVTIHGNGYTLDAKGKSRIFYITGSNLTLKDINFINGNYSYGGAIHWTGNNGKIENCNFTNNIALNLGGAIYWGELEPISSDGIEIGKNGTIINSKFINNHAEYHGGAIYWVANNGNIRNSYFKNNTANNNAGAIYWKGYEGIIKNNCEFINNTATNLGGAIFWHGNNGKITDNCNFINNTAYSIPGDGINAGGGAIYWYGENSNITNCSFINNTAYSDTSFMKSYKGGGAIYFQNGPTYLYKCIFMNNFANNYGSAIWLKEGIISNSIFLSNVADYEYIIYASASLTSNYNWFGNTANNHTINPNTGITNWLFLNATANPTVQVLNTTNITFKLLLYNSSSKNVTTYDNSQLKPVNLTITYTNGAVDKAIAKLNETIGYTPSIAGIGSVTARINGVEHTILVTVNLNPASVVVNNNTLDLTVDDTFELVATTTPGGLNVTYVPDESGVVTVDENGKITALKGGTAKIIVKVGGDGVYALNSTTVNVTVSKIHTEIIVKNNTINMKVNDEVDPGVSISPADAGELDYTSSDVSVVVVNGDGTFTAVGEGNTNVTIRFLGNDKYAATSKIINVTVSLNDANVTVNNNTLNLKIDETFNLVAITTPEGLNVTYLPDNSGVVSVDENGKITALKEGTAPIIVKINGKGIYFENSTTVTVTVSKIPTTINLTQDSFTLTVDDNVAAGASLTPPEAGNLTYTSNDASVAKVVNGKIIAVGPGSAKITVSFTGDKKYDVAANKTIQITVNNKPSPSPEPTINPSKKTVYKVKMYLTLKKVKKISKKTKKLYLKVIVKRNGKKLLTKNITIKVKRNKVKAKKTNKNKAKSKKLSKVQGFKFTVKINGKTYVQKTNKKGKITYTITNLYNKGTYKAKISYKSKYYKKNGKNIKFKVKA